MLPVIDQTFPGDLLGEHSLGLIRFDMASFLGRLWRWFRAMFASHPIYRLKKHTVRQINQIAEGGFAFVDLVENTRTRKRFALKRQICLTEEQLKIAREEVELLSRVDHPNIVKLHDSIELKDAHNDRIVVLMLMSLHSKGNLLSEIHKRKMADNWFHEHELLKLFLGICSAVSYLHNDMKPAIAHRDIKPGNILLDDKLGTVLTDFGSAAPASVKVTTRQEATALQEHASIHSTITYRAPELLHVKINSTISSKTDVWSLGCLLYAMCYGASPLDEVLDSGGSIALAVVDLHVRHSPMNRYSPAVRDLIDSMLLHNPKDRPSLKAIIKSVTAALSLSSSSVAIEVL